MTTPIEFIDEVLLHWPPFRWDEDREAAWVKAMTLELRPFGPEVLGKAIASMRRKKFPKTPQVAECISACVEARRWIDIESSKGKLPVEEQKPAADNQEDRKNHANLLVMCALGKQAAKEGWIGQLHAFCMRRAPDDTYRLPIGQEIADCKRKAKEFDQYYADCVREVAEFERKNPAQGKRKQVCHWHILEGLGAKMLKRREELTDMVLHGVVK